MNELTTLSDTALDKAIDDLKERELSLKTESGRKYLVGKMRELIGLLETWGYKTNGDESGLAMLWASGLQEEFVRLGWLGIKQAVTRWAEEDDSIYRTFPKIAWIADICKEIGGDPRVEKGRRIQVETERKIEEDHRKQMEHYRATHPADWKRITEEAKRRMEVTL